MRELMTEEPSSKKRLTIIHTKGHKNRERGVQAETVCKLLYLLSRSRLTLDQLAEQTSLSRKTIYRYLPVLSRYFPVIEQVVNGNTKYFYIEEESEQRQGPGGLQRTARFCKKGHDKYAPHGGYWVNQHGKLFLSCAVCRRKSNTEWYRTRRGKGKS